MKVLKCFFCLILFAPSPGFAQIFTKADTAKSKEIQKGITKLVLKAVNNFEDLRGKILKKDKIIIAYKAVPILKMNAQNYTITYYKVNGKSFYVTDYTEPHAMNIALICIGNMTAEINSNWITTEAAFTNKDLQGAWLRYKGAIVGLIAENVNRKTLTITIGIY
jgi:hypothetical protein